MTLKHAIPKTAEVTHSNGQSGGDIEWAIELLYNLVKTGSQLILETRSGRESQQKAGPPGLQLSNPGERERHNADGHKSGVNMLQFCSVSNSLSHTNLSNKVRGIYFFKEVFTRLLLRQYVFCMYMCIYAYLLCGYTTVRKVKVQLITVQ